MDKGSKDKKEKRSGRGEPKAEKRNAVGKDNCGAFAQQRLKRAV